MVAMPSGPRDRLDEHVASDPTPEEIRERSAAIRKNWSKNTRKRRSVYAPAQAWLPPGICVADVALNANQPEFN